MADRSRDGDDSSPSVMEMLQLPCRVTSLNIAGNKRTKRALIEAELAKAISARTHEELAVELALAHERLTQLDVFKRTDCEVDLAPNGNPGDLALNLKVDEKGTYTLSTGTFVQGGEGNLEASWTIRNVLGNAEKLQANISLGHKTSNSFKIEAVHPTGLGSSGRYNVSLFQSLSNFVKYSSFKERQRGLCVGWSDPESPHQLAYEASWRTIMPEKGTFAAIPTEATHSFKSSIKHTFSADTRDDTRMPSQGFFLRLTTELAGLGGDVKFAKQQVEMQAHVPTTIGPVISLVGALGMLQGLGGDKSRISDRFFVGGPLMMRGFRTKGLGPRAGRSPSGAKGGDAFFALSAALTGDMPSQALQAAGVKWHVFANAGNNESSVNGSSLPKLTTMLAKYRSVVGCGLVFPLQLGRLEFNYCWPIRTFREEGDRTTRWQVGLGFES